MPELEANTYQMVQKCACTISRETLTIMMVGNSNMALET